MKKRMIPLCVAFALLLSGCGWMDGSYVSVTPHQEQRQNIQSSVISASNYLDLMEILSQMVAAGTENAAISLSEYPSNAVESGMAVAVRYTMENDPIGAYAVEDIRYEIGSSGGKPAVAVNIQYRRSLAEIRQIHKIRKMDETEAIVAEALMHYDPGVVMLVENYVARDFVQFVENYTEANPHIVMEMPQVATGIYGNGQTRVVELIFTYQTARESLRQMQSQVKPVFDSASLYVSGDGSQWQKFSQLYAFLMERFEYSQETSITPTYSLLRHGVGDSRAFAVVYAQICEAAELECAIVTGTKNGEPWVWNIVMDNGYYYHVDLLRSSEAGRYLELTDAQMQGYVWDYSSYPKCTGHIPKETEGKDNPDTEPTEAVTEAPEEEESEETLPETTEEFAEETVPDTEEETEEK